LSDYSRIRIEGTGGSQQAATRQGSASRVWLLLVKTNRRRPRGQTKYDHHGTEDMATS